MKTPTEKQVRARRGHACILTSQRFTKSGCREASEVEVEGCLFRLCSVHEKRLREIVRDAKVEKGERHPRRAA